MSSCEQTDPLREASPNPSVCEACGQAFDCGASLAGCWCAQVALTESVRATLRERYSRCLCRQCLERLAQEERHK